MGSFDDLSEPERQLVDDFIRKSSDAGERLTEEPIVIGDDIDVATAEAAIVQVLSLISDDVDPTTLRLLTLDRLEREIKSRSGDIVYPSEDIPDDADVTREKLSMMLIKDEVINYFLLVGALIEQFTIELVFEEVTADERQSEDRRSRIERMSENKREDLLYMTGVLNGDENGKVRRAYGLRNDLAHAPDPATVIDTIESVENDIERTRETLNLLHEKVHGVPINHRLSELLTGGE